MEPRSEQTYFDPDLHPEDTLKAFEEFVDTFELRYEAQFPDPPKVSIDTAIQRWKYANATDEVPDPRPSLEQYDQIRDNWRSKDKVAKFLGMFSSKRFQSDWKAAETLKGDGKIEKWDVFLVTMNQYYKPTENPTLKNFQFRALVQMPQEAFPAFCNRVVKEAKHCHLKCHHEDCSAEDTAIRDQIVIGTINNGIREEALKKSWDLPSLRRGGMQIESAERGGAEIAGEGVNKLGKYSYSKLKTDYTASKANQRKEIKCFNCGNSIKGSIAKHKEACPAQSSKCSKCGKIGHFPQVCRTTKPVRAISGANNQQDNAAALKEKPDEDDSEIYNINLFRIIKSQSTKPKLCSRNYPKNDFTTQVVVNNNLVRVIADTGARVNVCGTVEARKWGLLGKMVPSKVQIKPYNSPSIKVHGEARCAVTFGATSIPTVWHIISGSCEPILSGNAALQLGIVKFNGNPETYHPILMVDKEFKDGENIQNCLIKYPENFSGLGKLRNHKVKLHTKADAKPVAVQMRAMPYHLQERGHMAIEEMLTDGVIEEHPRHEPAPWVSNCVLAPKPDGGIRITLDARAVNKAIEPTNSPIPRPEDIKAKLAGCRVFSKMDLKSAFWQLELEEDSRHLTVFHANGKLYRYKRLTMGLKSAQGELNNALQPLFADIEGAYIIHDDLIVATTTESDHIKAIEQIMQVTKESGITFNAPKCHFGKPEIKFWGCIYGKNGVRPDPEKVECLKFITPPNSKSEVISFLCMMQSNADFIRDFAKQSAPLRELTKSNVRFKWHKEHQECFDTLISAFKKDTLLRYFDMSKPTFIFADGHKTGLGAMLAQGETRRSAKPVAFASRSTQGAEHNYPQIDLEAMAMDFGLRRFRQYIIGSPNEITVVTDHKPLDPIFNGKRKGSIRSEKIKLRHQDIRFHVVYEKGNLNQADFMSRHAKPFSKITNEEQEEANDINNTLYMLHMTPIIDCLSISKIAQMTSADDVLQQLKSFIISGKTISKKATPELKKFEQIFEELTIAGNGIILKGERIILPKALHAEAIKLAHRGSHPGQSGVERRLRQHFFFHSLQEKVKDFVKSCPDCLTFTDKKVSHPISAHKVPNKCWEAVSVDLFGPMPSRKHVVVVQDMASRFPAAKLVTSTRADKVLPALAEIYDCYGNPDKQLSDNGPPFNSVAMEQFAEKRDITLQKIPPLHPSSNPVETFMKPLGKAMKISNYNGNGDKQVIQQLLSNYRDTPHPATNVSPGSMLFRDGMKTSFPRTTLLESDIKRARKHDEDEKNARQELINSSKYKKREHFSKGDAVLMRNHQKNSKFEPVFHPVPCIVREILRNGLLIKLERQSDGKEFLRHPDDVKEYTTQQSWDASKSLQENGEWEYQWTKTMLNEQEDGSEGFDYQWTKTTLNEQEDGSEGFDVERGQKDDPQPQQVLRRSERAHHPNRRYVNDEFVKN